MFHLTFQKQRLVPGLALVVLLATVPLDAPAQGSNAPTLTFAWESPRTSTPVHYNVYLSVNAAEFVLVKQTPTPAISFAAKAGDTYQLKVQAVYPTGFVSPMSIPSEPYTFHLAGTPLDSPMANEVLPNYPNPFNPETWMPFQIATDAQVTITIYNAGGEQIRTLSLGYRSAGKYLEKTTAAYWDGRTATGEQVASGVYFYTLQTSSGFSATRKMLVVK